MTPAEGDRRREFRLAIGAIGVVFGDIGTSPLYALRECFSPAFGMDAARDNVLGVVSLLLWSLTIVVCVKYLALVLQADNKGEGGILALVSLVSRHLPKASVRRKALYSVIGILGAALLLGDGMITPAISVLSAVEGLEVMAPGLAPWFPVMALAILLALFPLQYHGTTRVGRIFGPIIILWFLVMAILGFASVLSEPGILAALNPLAAVGFVLRNGRLSFGILGAVFLALTGAEVLYADLGHFGAGPIRKAWFFLVYPSLILSYLGQGAYTLSHPGEVSNLFYRLAPPWAMYPLILLATAATIIASQAVITGAFSLARQAVQLGLWPRVRISHTSDETIGQVYVPLVNWTLLAGTVGLVFVFRTSEGLANAYGIAVSATMLMTAVLMIVLARNATKISPWVIYAAGGLFLAFDLAFFLSNVSKVVNGGWIVIVFAAALFILMKTWKDGRGRLVRIAAGFRMDPAAFARSISENPPLRVPGTAIFMSADPKGIPRTLLHNLKYNKVLHENTIVLSVHVLEDARVDPARRVSVTAHRGNIWFVVLHFGFSETPDIPRALAGVDIPGIGFGENPTYFLGRERIVIRDRNGMPRWRKKIFKFMFENASSPTDFFCLPSDAVVAIGSHRDL